MIQRSRIIAFCSAAAASLVFLYFIAHDYSRIPSRFTPSHATPKEAVQGSENLKATFVILARNSDCLLSSTFRRRSLLMLGTL